jgi:hypothetical protein
MDADEATAGQAVSQASSTYSSAATLGGVRRCGTHDLDANQQAAADRAIAANRAQKGASAKKQDPLNIPVHFHVITTSTGFGDSSALVPAQIDVLNAAYAGTGASFTLVSLEVVANDAWFTAAVGSPEETEMKNSLRQGGSTDLNLYTGVNDGSLLGWATFPQFYNSSPLYDGVVLAFDSLPGGGLEFPFDPTQEPDGLIAYDRGDTATHEVGHWLGLFHTFQGGCKQNGDRVDDTPAEAEPQFFCAPRDSCTGKKFPGTDPIYNFMDYVDDDCMFEFTTNQEERMRDQWDAFRVRG